MRPSLPGERSSRRPPREERLYRGGLRVDAVALNVPRVRSRCDCRSRQCLRDHGGR